MEAIRTVDLCKKYKDVTAVDGLNLTVYEGEIFALLGVNGAGKTTTVNMLSCLAEPTGGDALIMGKSILSECSEVKSMIAISPQESAIAPMLTVRENLELICGVHGLGKKESKRKIEETIELVSLKDVSDKRAGKLSGGYQRRLSIAMALICRPKILFLDEPTIGLDVIARSELWEVIKSLRGKATVILTTHYMEEAEELADRAGIMKSGRLLVSGSIDDIKAKAKESSFEKAFIKIIKEAQK